MELGASRWFTIRCAITRSAASNAASTAVSSTAPSRLTPVPLGSGPRATLFGKPACSTAGCPVIALSGSTTAGNGSYSTAMASAASRAT